MRNARTCPLAGIFGLHDALTTENYETLTDLRVYLERKIRDYHVAAVSKNDLR